jgi:hypothetical protein
VICASHGLPESLHADRSALEPRGEGENSECTSLDTTDSQALQAVSILDPQGPDDLAVLIDNMVGPLLLFAHHALTSKAIDQAMDRLEQCVKDLRGFVVKHHQTFDLATLGDTQRFLRHLV